MYAECLTCHQPFQRTKARGRRRVYCSSRCQRRRNSPESRICPTCRSAFRPHGAQVYCQRLCDPKYGWACTRCGVIRDSGGYRRHTTRDQYVCHSCRGVAPRGSGGKTVSRQFVPTDACCPVCRASFMTHRARQVYCSPECRMRRRRSFPKKQTATERGYNHAHRKRRAQLLPMSIGTMCPLRISPNCTGLMTDPSRMDLDHSVPRALGGSVGDRMVCSPCNRSRGASLGNRLRRGVPPIPRVTSQVW